MSKNLVKRLQKDKPRYIDILAAVRKIGNLQFSIGLQEKGQLTIMLWNVVSNGVKVCIESSFMGKDTKQDILRIGDGQYCYSDDDRMKGLGSAMIKLIKCYCDNYKAFDELELILLSMRKLTRSVALEHENRKRIL